MKVDTILGWVKGALCFHLVVLMMTMTLGLFQDWEEDTISQEKLGKGVNMLGQEWEKTSTNGAICNGSSKSNLKT